ncbi:hypothetical protein [Burkholderia multivorans]|nr:hypothetical protein [Burkholderia multivorans]MDN8032424.1 hypothetical protein [Burkholderia multivorans]
MGDIIITETVRGIAVCSGEDDASLWCRRVLAIDENFCRRALPG